MTTQSTAPPAEVLSRKRPGVGPQHRRSGSPWRQTAFSVVVYTLVAMLSNRTAWTHGIAHSIQTSGGSDVQEEIWFLAQTPWAIVHGVNPFANNWLNTPAGVNLMDNTAMPLLGVLGAPITFLFGPVGTFNVMIDVAFITSAAAFFLMARRFVTWWPAAFVGGLLYGFSPYAVAEGNAHLFLLVGSIPPLVILALNRTLIMRTGSPWLGGVAVGTCFAAEFYISTETFATMIVIMCLAAVAVAVSLLVTRTRLDTDRLVKLAVATIATGVILIGYGAWMTVAGPGHIVGPAQSSTVLAGISSDPVGLVVPTANQHFTFGHAALGDSLVAPRNSKWQVEGNAVAENGTYVGVPLLLILIAGTVAFRRRRIVLLIAVMALLAMVLSMGPHLHVDGHLTAIPLPFDVLAHLPLLDSSVSSRYVGFFWLFAALLLALILDGCLRVMRGTGAPAHRARALTGCWALVVLALVPLVPAWPYSSTPSDVPAWFTSSEPAIPVGAVVLVYPLASFADDRAMVWQAAAGLRFRMPGGYAVFAGPGGHATFSSAPSMLQQALALCWEGRALPLTPDSVRSQLRAWGIRQVVVSPGAPGATCAARLFGNALGAPRRRESVLLWPS